MDDSDRRSCPVCWEHFRTPKLLPCKHTFCVKCLQKFAKTSVTKEAFPCPLCRSVCAIPAAGVNDYITNYFAVDFATKNKIKLCDMCFKGKHPAIKECSHCGLNTCSSCFASHRKALLLSESFDLDDPICDPDFDSNSESDTSSDLIRRRVVSNDFRIPFILQLSVGHVRIKQEVSLLSSFKAIAHTDLERKFINCVCPVSSRECWVIPTAGPSIQRYDISGNLYQSLPIGELEKVRDVACDKEGCLLIALMTSNLILKFQYEVQASIFTYTGKYSPIGITSFPDGRIAVAAVFAFGTETEEVGQLQIYDETGILIKSVGGCSKSQPLLKRPFSVAFNKLSEKIFLCDRGNNFVFVFADDGKFLTKYGIQNRPGLLSLLEGDSFHPLCLCIDNNGFVIVINGALGALHILDKDGSFIGLVVTNHPDQFGHPLCIGCDQEGQIWIGDNEDQTVRVYQTTSFINTLDSEQTSGLSLDYPSMTS